MPLRRGRPAGRRAGHTPGPTRIGAWSHSPTGRGRAGASVRSARGADGSACRLIVGTAVVSTGDMATMDADNGPKEGNVNLQYIAARPNSWDIDTRQLAPIGDIDGDGVDDSRDAFPDNSAELADTDGHGIGDNGDADGADGVRDGSIGATARSLTASCDCTWSAGWHTAPTHRWLQNRSRG